MATGSVTVTTPRKSVSVRTRFIQHGAISPRPTLWKAVLTPENLAAPPSGTSTSSCAVSFKITHFSIRPLIGKKISPLALPWRPPKALQIPTKVSS